MAKRNLYLETMPVDKAVEIYLDAVGREAKEQTEIISVTQSLNRVTADAVYAKCCSPLFNAAAMDGIAVRTQATAGASEKNPITLEPETDYQIVDTGDPVKLPYDAVIMAEELIETPEGKIKIIAAASTWQHIRPIGEDIVAGEMLLPGKHKIRSVDIAVMLSAGVNDVEVVKKPKVAIFPTGTEIIEPGEAIKEGSIIESNSRMFENMVAEEGAEAVRFAHIEDDYELIRNRIDEAVEEYDMVIVNAGSSAGTEDYTVHVLRELGEVLVHGVSIKPGKPVILALVRSVPVIGLPGYPVSAYIGFRNFVSPVLSLMGKTGVSQCDRREAVITRRIVSSLKYKEYVRVKMGSVEGKLVATPLSRGAGAAMSLVKADGFCVIEQNEEGVEAGQIVSVELNRPLEEIENTVVSIGSHDLIIDIIGDMMTRKYNGMYVSGTHVGSMGGLMALKRKEAHIAPVHLLDEATGEYNISYIKRIFSEPMALIKGVERIQGIMVKKGNPLNINGIKDLTGCRYVNRQKGAGTRILLDYKMKQENIEPESITGYEREAATHMAVAAAVADESADAGMGVMSAAKSMGLDFIEVGREEYDFAVPAAYLELPHIMSFIRILKSEEFHKKLDELGGYGYSSSGEVIFI